MTLRRVTRRGQIEDLPFHGLFNFATRFTADSPVDGPEGGL